MLTWITARVQRSRAYLSRGAYSTLVCVDIDDAQRGLKRNKTRIPAELLQPWQEKLSARHEVGSSVLLEILRAAKLAADAGVPLPPNERLPAHVVDVWWPQHPDQYRQWADTFQAAGSSVRAVITAGVRAYVDDPSEFRTAGWTPFPGPGAPE